MSLLLSIVLAAAQPHEQPRLAKTGDCGWVHGRYGVSNGSGIHRIWMIGTNHMINLDVSDEGVGPFPELIAAGRFEPFRNFIYGDFYVCAMKGRVKGQMQEVHLMRYRKIVITD